ncbi:MAG: HAMP domain-containing histidine kinase [Candidatus Saccharimonas sp.]|nr:HAMP domain-containing histidine kinase [Planctomycetaceae bacterium]
MTIDCLDKLAVLVKQEREALLSGWRVKVRKLPSARNLDVPTLNDHIPILLDELAAALCSPSEQTITEALAEGSSSAHGLQRVQDAFDIEEVVAEYNILRGCIHDLADENGLTLQGKAFHILNLVFDQAIGTALQAYATQRATEVQRRREEYLAFVAHDLRTPLNAIALAGKFFELTLIEAKAAAETTRMLKAMGRSVQQLQGLIGKILEENTNLETEAGVKLERRAVDLWPLVESLIHDLHPVAGTNSTRLVNNVPDDMVVYADALLLRRIFQNLIANAIKYTPRGEIVIGAEPSGEEGSVECWVRDNGTGITEEALGRVFEKGETDPQNSDGSGLGLAIVKTFTEAHGGKVGVESRPGAGSTFRFSLPARAKVIGQKA